MSQGRFDGAHIAKIWSAAAKLEFISLLHKLYFT
uniref:Uncharacterized protein n=1 Tax=Arundo donax TaxID=35708 RepID=A0A0A9GZA9_ARUDO